MSDTYTWDDGTNWGHTLQEVEHQIETWLRHEADTKIRQIHPEQPVPDTDKWLASSGLQKAIRRGLPDTAARMAATLDSHDPAYFWRRAPVIALEDIGLANLPLVAAMTWISGKAAYRRKLATELQWATWFSQQMATSVKDRSAEKLYLAVNADPTFAPQAAHIAAQTVNTRHRLLATSTSLKERLAAFMAISGVHPVSHVVTGIPDNSHTRHEGSMERGVAALRDIVGVPALVQSIAKCGRSANTPFHLTLPMAWTVAAKAITPHPQAVTDDLTTPLVGGLWPAPALDAHTRAGKRAISAFLEAKPEVAKAVEHVPDYLRKEAISKAVFLEEGVRCDRYLEFEGAGDIQHAGSVNLLTSVGVDRARMSDVLSSVANNLDCLTRARWKVTEA